MNFLQKIAEILFPVNVESLHRPAWDNAAKAKAVPLEINLPKPPPTHQVAGQIFLVEDPGDAASQWSKPSGGELLGRAAKLTAEDLAEINASIADPKRYSLTLEKYIAVKTLWAQGEEYTAKTISRELTAQFKTGYGRRLVEEHVAAINRAFSEMRAKNAAECGLNADI